MEFLRARRSAVLTLAFLVLICLIAVLSVHLVNKPVSAPIITTNNPAPTTAAPPPQLVKVDGTYANFSYPSSMRTMTNAQTPTSPVLDSYNYLKTDILTWHLAIAISHLNTPSLNDDSSYVFRKNNPTEYQESTVTYGDNTFIVMTDVQAEGFSEVAFSLHGNMDATISLLGDDPNGDSGLDTTFQQVLQSWDWQ